MEHEFLLPVKEEYPGLPGGGGWFDKLKLNSTTPSRVSGTPLLWKKRRGNFRATILF